MEEHLRNGSLKPVLGPTYPLDGAAEALQCLDQRAATGKVVLLTSPTDKEESRA